ncbi:MAG: phosphate starvation-inducible protein PhoH [Beggiatoa sp. IS2]|nr:MAG: phosphate starvation-inducible protein PhoH [Beggiatoa sp. IS2]
MTKRLFILDTNVLMHDPTAIFRFQEHAVYLPMVVLEELDAAKKGTSEVARNVRQVSRYLDELISTDGLIKEGLKLHDKTNGRLFFQTEALSTTLLPDFLSNNKPDNGLLSTAIALQQTSIYQQVIIVSKDINLRIKARILGIQAEDYTNDQVLEDVDLLYSGEHALEPDFWQSHHQEILTECERSRTMISGTQVAHWYPNQFLFNLQDEPNYNSSQYAVIVRELRDHQAIVEPVHNFCSPKNNVWGVTARNRQQNFALNLLVDPEIDFVTLMGAAGTGKTLLALAAGLAQTLDQQRYREIIVTRVTVPVGEDIGFLPGTEEEKMTPWMGALVDNLEVLSPTHSGGEWGRAATADLLHHRIKIRSLNFMRGRTFLNRYIILDEAQNLTPKQMKTLVTRAGPGTKIVCLGNIAQIDTPYLTETSSGLTYVVDHFKQWQHSGHITLQRGERSRLADFASQTL